MQLRNLSPGDRLECNVRGRRFVATAAAAPENGTIAIQPPKGVNYHRVTARQVERKLAGAPSWDPESSQVRRSQ